MTRVLLTGAAGFAGSHCLRHLLMNTDWDIVCPVTYDHKGHLSRIDAAVSGQDAGRVRLVEQDLAQPWTTATVHALDEPGYIIDYASQSHVDRSITDPGPFVMNNVALTLNVLQFARTLPRLRTLVHVSTDECFGPVYGGEPFTEDAQHRPSNPYAASKSAQSQLGFAWWRTYGVPFVEIYGCNMFGEHAQNTEKFVPMVIAKVRAGEIVPIHASADGVPGSRFWQHARNVADGILFILQHVTPSTYGEHTVPSRFNITSGDRISNLDMAQAVADGMGLPLRYELVDFHSSRPGHDLAYGIDGARLHELGWKAPVSFAEGIARLAKRALSEPESVE